MKTTMTAEEKIAEMNAELDWFEEQPTEYWKEVERDEKEKAAKRVDW